MVHFLQGATELSFYVPNATWYNYYDVSNFVEKDNFLY